MLVPHSEKRFPGYDPETKELDAETLQRYIVGGHVAEFMENLEEEDEERYRKHFAKYLEDEVSSEDLEEVRINSRYSFFLSLKSDSLFLRRSTPTHTRLSGKTPCLSPPTSRMLPNGGPSPRSTSMSLRSRFVSCQERCPDSCCNPRSPRLTNQQRRLNIDARIKAYRAAKSG
jgi:hypothetical protein